MITSQFGNEIRNKVRTLIGHVPECSNDDIREDGVFEFGTQWSIQQSDLSEKIQASFSDFDDNIEISLHQFAVEKSINVIYIGMLLDFDAENNVEIKIHSDVISEANFTLMLTKDNADKELTRVLGFYTNILQPQD
ncbi:hypothetical protein JE939_002804 [Yersinia ruckeri]|nr:hypothetical protein [Yersinia ruckeri]